MCMCNKFRLGLACINCTTTITSTHTECYMICIMVICSCRRGRRSRRDCGTGVCCAIKEVIDGGINGEWHLYWRRGRGQRFRLLLNWLSIITIMTLNMFQNNITVSMSIKNEIKYNIKNKTYRTYRRNGEIMKIKKTIKYLT